MEEKAARLKELQKEQDAIDKAREEGGQRAAGELSDDT